MGLALAALPLFLFQQLWMQDLAQFKIINKSRQIGITFVTTLAIVMRCIVKKEKWYYLSVSEARAAEAIEYCVLHCLAIGLVADLQESWMSFGKIKYKRLVITFPNGSQIIALPANARTARGAVGNLVLDEFGHHLQSAEIWKAVSALSTWGHRIWIISTPNGMQGEFYRIWTGGGKHDPEAITRSLKSGIQPIADVWSRHEVDVFTAKEQGHPVDLERARELAGNDEHWHQEYCAKFLDEAYAWLPYKLIESAYGDDATLWFDSSQPPAGALYGGFDVARKRDLSVLWINEQLGAKAITRGVLTLKGVKFSEQKKQVWDHMPFLNRICIDSNGVGAQIAEECVDDWGESVVEPVSPHGDIPAKLAAKVRERFEKGTIEIPDDPEIRADLHSVRRVYTMAGNVRFEAPRTKDGHADRFWALALALQAGEGGVKPFKAGDFQGGETRMRSIGRNMDSGY